MSSVVISGDTSGAITLSAPAVAGTNTITLPASTGTVMVNGPAFSAYLSSASQSVSSNTWTKVTLNAEEFDTANCFDSTTNYRFTPTVAGYYQISACVYGDATSANPVNVGVAIYKNGTNTKQNLWAISGASCVGQSSTSALIYMNGSTDYIEMYGRLGNGTGPIIDGGTAPTLTFMSGCLVRTA